MADSACMVAYMCSSRLAEAGALEDTGWKVEVREEGWHCWKVEAELEG